MTNETFNFVVDANIVKIKDIIIKKGKEYAKGEDRLQAFKDVAELRHTSTEDALGGMVSKQIVSLFDMIQRTTLAFPISVDDNSYSIWKEKLIDIIVYMILLDAIILEKVGFIKGEDYDNV